MPDKKVFTNPEVAELLRAVAAAYQLKDEKGNRFKIIAYQKAADAVEHASSELKDLWDDGKLSEIPGVGPSIAQHLDELFKTGKSKHFGMVLHGLPPAMFDLMQIPGIGAKRAFRLTKELGVGSIDELEKVVKAGKVATMEGFGEESQKAILDSIVDYRNKGTEVRQILPYAQEVASEIMAWMKKHKDLEEINPLGSLRRRAATIGDIDLAASTKNPKEILKHFTEYPNKTRVLELGDRSAGITLPSGIQVDLMVESPSGYGALLQHFTGSKHHNIALRNLALKKGWSLSDYGVKKVGSEKVQQMKTEEELYKFLGMDWIPPEMREDTGEIQAAQEGKLPKLIELKDIKGDLQIHSDYDVETSHDLGASSMQEVVEEAMKLGYEYVAFTEHNPSRSKHTDAQIIDILKRKREYVDKLNDSIKTKHKGRAFKVFNSLEIDMMPSGELPVPEEGLLTLDFALISIHSAFRQSRAETTARILRAFDNPRVRVFAHPTGRKLGHREGADIDWDKVFEYALARDKWIEINAEPMRLDLPDMLVRDAVKRGVKLTMGTDSHHKDALTNMQYGISVARRGWATANDIVNTRGLGEFEELLKNTGTRD